MASVRRERSLAVFIAGLLSGILVILACGGLAALAWLALSPKPTGPPRVSIITPLSNSRFLRGETVRVGAGISGGDGQFTVRFPIALG